MTLTSTENQVGSSECNAKLACRLHFPYALSAYWFKALGLTGAPDSGWKLSTACITNFTSLGIKRWTTTMMGQKNN